MAAVVSPWPSRLHMHCRSRVSAWVSVTQLRSPALTERLSMDRAERMSSALSNWSALLRAISRPNGPLLALPHALIVPGFQMCANASHSQA